jgi:hypothetical protein
MILGSPPFVYEAVHQVRPFQLVVQENSDVEVHWLRTQFVGIPEKQSRDISDMRTCPWDW